MKILSTDMEKLCDNKMLVFTCSAIIEDVEKVFELKYDVDWCGCFITFDKWNMQNIVDNMVR